MPRAQGTIEICVAPPPPPGPDMPDDAPSGPGCGEWQLVSQYAVPDAHQSVCGPDGCSPCSYEPGDGSYAAGGVSHTVVSFAPALQDVFKVRLTFDSASDDGNEGACARALHSALLHLRRAMG